jgi:hypothetical protein
MPGSGERAYAYAKACGIIGKSFVGRGVSRLSAPGRLADLDRLVFPDNPGGLPERELLVDLQRRFLERAVSAIISILKSYRKPPELLVRLLRTYEYADLQAALNAMAGGEAKAPPFTELAPYRQVKFEAYPDLKGMLRGTEFEFILDKISGDNINDIHIQTELDKEYYRLLWEALEKTPRRERGGIEFILKEEVALRNSSWVLRMRTYYRMDSREIEEMLVEVPGREGHRLSEDARQALGLPLDHFEPWRTWKRAALLNKETPGQPWTADPRVFQNEASRRLYALARHYFHLRPFSIDTPACFIKLKQFEEDLLTSLSEGLTLGLASKDVFELLEVQP